MKLIKILFSFNKKLNTIMANQHEIAQQLAAFQAQLTSAVSELKTKFDTLSGAVQNSDSVSPELQAAFDAFAPAVQGVTSFADSIAVASPVTEPAPAEPASSDTPATDGSTVTTEIPTV